MLSLHNGGRVWVLRVSDTKYCRVIPNLSLHSGGRVSVLRDLDTTSCRAMPNAVPAQLWT